MFGFGGNGGGQLGISGGEEAVLTPTETPFTGSSQAFVRIAANATQTDVATESGLLYTCGENDSNELGRSGKRSLLHRVDAVETFRVTDVAVGNNFSIIACHDGRFISWGRNESGQLGNGTRERKDKPRQVSSSHSMLQVTAGAEHVVGLTTDGSVITWGANRKGQLGNGQFTSSCVPEVIKLLRHRPVISIACGESHTLALTIGGNIYAWGDNSQGQLGVGDTVNRLRPEMVRSLRNALASSINAGKQHSMVVSPRGTLFAFGSNSHGQLGLGESGSDMRYVLTPTVVERLSKYRVLHTACGSAHTLVLCCNMQPAWINGEMSSPGRPDKFVFVMGLNSSGQLGLGHTHSVCTPTQLGSLTDGNSANVSYVVSGPLAFHSFVLSDAVSLVPPALPSVDMQYLKTFVDKYSLANCVDAPTLNHFRERIAAAFSSISVLNSSFRRLLLQDVLGEGQPQSPRNSAAVGRHGLNLNLIQVRDAYNSIFSINNDLILATLGRSTLAVSEQLRECPFDDAENLSVFLIVLENPFLLVPSKYHVVIQRVITGILSLPKSYRILLFSWLRDYESEYFARIVKVLQNYLSFTCEDSVSSLDSSPPVLVLESLFECNRDAKIVPNELFYNSSILKKYNVYEEWGKFKTSELKSVFNICAYPFLLPLETKNKLMISDFDLYMTTASVQSVNKYVIGPLAAGAERRTPTGVIMEQSTSDGGINVYFEISVDRENIVEPTLKQVAKALADDPDTLKLPLRIRFVGEDAIDMGGVKKEFMGLFMKAYISENGVFGMCGGEGPQSADKANLLWFKRNMHYEYSSDDQEQKRPRSDSRFGSYSEEYLIGVMLGLAMYHRVLVSLPIPLHMYKLLKGSKLSLSELWAVEPDLARGLQFLLDYEVGVSIQEDIGTTFVASANPLLQSTVSSTPDSVELRPGGRDISVNKANRAEFVELFVQHALYGSCKEAVDDFLNGWKSRIQFPVTSMCTDIEVEALTCGSVDLREFMKLREHTSYEGEYNSDHPHIDWFWDILASFSVTQQRQFLEFVTGSSRIPVGGIQNIKLVVQSTMQPDSALPTAHTCFNTLKLPISYQSKAAMYEKLTAAIENCQGFGFL